MFAEIYRDWENNRESLGVAKLVKHIRSGLPFIPDFVDIGVRNSEKRPKVYTWELWSVEFIAVTPLGEHVLERTFRKEFKIRKNDPRLKRNR